MDPEGLAEEPLSPAVSAPPNGAGDATPVMAADASSGGEARSVEQQLAAMLDSKFLVTKPMADFFAEVGVAEELMSFVTLTAWNVDFSSLIYPRPLETITERPQEATDALRRSYRLMEFFLQKSQPFEKFVESNIDKIFTQLFNVFHPSSTGSLYHWSKIFLSLLQKNTMALRAAFCKDAQLFERMLPYVHESPVGDALVHFLGYGQFSPADRAAVWQWVEKESVLQRIVATASMSESGSRQACDVIARILDRIAVLPGSGRVAAVLYSEPFVRPLLESVSDAKRNAEVVSAATELLHKLFFKSDERLLMEAKTNVAQEMPNYFAGSARELLLDSVVPHVEHLVEGLFLTRNTLRHPNKRELAAGVPPDAQLDLLTPQRTLLLEVLCSMTRARPDSVLPMLVPALWRTLVAWCEEHAEANIFHLHANRMIEMLVRRGDDKTHKNVFTKSKIISRFSSLALPDLREDGLHAPSSYCGFAILNVSLVILEGLKRGEDTYLYNMITHSEPWPEISSLILRRARLLGNARSWNDITLPAPSAGAQMNNRNAYLRILPFVSPDSVVPSGELPPTGEQCYCWLLGYGENGWQRKPTAHQQHKEQEKQKVDKLDGGGAEEEAATKKKKKKKNKNKNKKKK